MKKFFGLGGGAPAPNPQQAAAVKKEYDIHKMVLAAEKMEAYISASESKIEKLTKENELIKEKIVGLLKIGKKDMAKRFLLKKKKNEELMASIQKRTMAMQGFLLNMEDMKQNQEFVQAMAAANTAMQAKQQDVEAVQQVLQDARDFKQESELRQNEMDELLNEANEDDEDIDEMMKYYEDEIATDMKKQHEHAMPVKKTEPKLVQKPQAAAVKKDDFEDMLGKLLTN